MSRFWSGLLLLVLLTVSAAAQPDLISLNVRDAALNDVIFMLAVQSGKNVVTSGSIGSDRVTLQLRNVSFAEALDVLARSHDLQIRLEKGMYLIGKRAAPGARPRAASFRSASTVPEISASAAVIATNKRTAALIVNGTTATAPRAPHVAAAQSVVFDVRVVDVQAENAQSDVRLEFGGVDVGEEPLTAAGSYAFAKSSRTVTTRLSELINMGRAKILGGSKFVASNDHEADLVIGGTYPTLFSDQKTGRQQVQFVDVGVKLRLTPTIGIDGSVIAELRPQYSTVEVSTDGVPVLADRGLHSILRVRTDQTIVLGGLLEDIDAQTLTKMPLLGDIPILGAIFRSRQHQAKKDEIIFLITARALAPPKAARSSRGRPRTEAKGSGDVPLSDRR